LLAAQVKPARGDTQPPLRVERNRLGQGRTLRRHPPVEYLLGERRPVIRLMSFVADQRQRTGEALTTQRCSCLQARK
jgi:hypothetical protein